MKDRYCLLGWALAFSLFLQVDTLALGSLHAQTAALGLSKDADTIFTRLGKKEGPPNVAVASIVQDADGFLWIGSGSGVARWDGYHFKNYTMKVGVPDALPDNDVWTLYVDPQKRLWIGTATRGLVLYDPVHDDFHTYRPQGEAAFKTIHAIATDGKKGLWVLSGRGLDHFDPDSGAFAHVDMPGIGPKQNMYDLCHDAKGHIVLATIKGLYRGDADGQHFAAWKVFDGPPPRVIALFVDDGGRTWIGTPRGVYLIPAGGEKATLVQENGENGKPLAGNPLAAQGVQAFAQAAPGLVWVGTVGDGIVEVNTKTMAMRRIVHQPAVETSLLDDSVIAFFRDSSGTLWIATQNGVSHVVGGTNGIETLFGNQPGNSAKADDAGRPIEDEVNAVLPRQDGSVVLGLGMKGFEIIDAAGRRKALVEPHAMQPGSVLPMGILHGLAEAPDGTLYLGTAAGVYRADHDGRHVALVPGGPTPLPLVYQLIYDPGASRDSGTLWIATDTGVWKQDVSGKVPAQAMRVPVPNATTQAIARSGNDLWVGTSSDLYRYDVKTGGVEEISIAPESGGGTTAAIFSLALDHQQRLWVATNGGGLMVLTGRDAKGHPVFQTVKGLPDGNVDGVEAGQDGRMWASTDDGVAVVDPKTMEATPLGGPDGVEILSSWPNALGAAADGTMLFAGQGGLTMLQPQAVKPWTYMPPVVVTTVRVAGKVVPFDNAAPSTIEVTHEANSLEVEFASLDFTAPELNQYEYRLVGFDRDWVKTDADRHSANYTNLPPGRYRLELRGSNRAGMWGPTREVDVHQLPAWWQTWWARLLFAVLFLLGLLAAFYALTAYQRRRQRLLEAAVTERTLALQQSQQELEASHRRMEQIAYSDSLTGIANRRLFNDRFRRLINKKQGTGSGFVLMLIDLDKFKQINDTFGHDAGDAWLKAVAARMRPFVLEEECFARLGGDEFGILMTQSAADEAIAQECEAIAGLFVEPVSVQGVEIGTTLSIGVAVFETDATTLESLYKAADIALYSVKREGGNGWRRYTPDMPGGRGHGESPSSGKPRATDPV